MSQLYDAAPATSGLRATQRAVLSYVSRFGTPTMSEPAAVLVLDRTALHNLKPLKRDGYARLVIAKDDRRIRRVLLTWQGEAELQEPEAAWLQARDCFEAAFAR